MLIESVEFDIDRYKSPLLRVEEEMAQEREMINPFITQSRKSGLSYIESSKKVMKLFEESECRKPHRSTAIR